MHGSAIEAQSASGSKTEAHLGALVALRDLGLQGCKAFARVGSPFLNAASGVVCCRLGPGLLAEQVPWRPRTASKSSPCTTRGSLIFMLTMCIFIIFTCTIMCTCIHSSHIPTDSSCPDWSVYRPACLPTDWTDRRTDLLTDKLTYFHIYPFTYLPTYLLTY